MTKKTMSIEATEVTTTQAIAQDAVTIENTINPPVDVYSKEILTETTKRAKVIKTELGKVENSFSKIAFNLHWIYENSTLCMSLSMLFGSVLTVSAEETNEDFYYNGTEIDEETGKYMYRIIISNYTDSENYVTKHYEFLTSSPICAYYDEEQTSDSYVRDSYKIGCMTNGYLLNTLSGYEVTYTSQTNCVNGVVEHVTLNGQPSVFYIYKSYGDVKRYDTFSTNIPVVGSKEEAEAFLTSGDDSAVTNKKPVINQSLYFKNVGYTVRAENSSEYPDETYITFTWDTDNLQSGDCLEIMTKNHYTKIGGDQVIGFHNYLTASSGIDCFVGSYEMSQTSAVKAWFETVENKPLVFKDYDTDMYFLRPVRGNQQGLWVRVTMGRTTPTSSPYITDIEYGDFTDDGDWIVDDNVTVSEGGNHGIDQGGNIITGEEIGNMIQLDNIGDLFKYLIGNLEILVGYFGQLPQLINAVIGWLPSSVIVLICGSIAVVILLRIFGR